MSRDWLLAWGKMYKQNGENNERPQIITTL